VLVGKPDSVTGSPAVSGLAAVYVNVAISDVIEYWLIAAVSGASNPATAGLLDVHVTVVGAGPAVPFESIVDTENPTSSVCPGSNIVGSGTVAFAGEIAIDVTVAAVTVKAAVVVVGADGSVQIVGSAAPIVAAPAVVPAANWPAASGCAAVLRNVTIPDGVHVNTAIPVIFGDVPSE